MNGKDALSFLIARSSLAGRLGPAVLGLLLAAAPAPLLAADSASPAAGAPALNQFMVALSVKDLEAETIWYVETLGFSVEKDVSIGDGRVFFRWLRLGTARLELVHSPAATDATPARAKPPAHAGLHGYSHFTLETADIEATRAALAARGVTPTLDITEVKELGIKVLYLTDPEGNAVEIAQRVSG